ncbi:uncharacterized protein LOC106090293 [Stomoxys calcitrans]|uniref:Uncharacterized protein n=1 Tax=Stomoxys calcitrans TaxID=35570 RepID=A0A1I8NXF3_STOCA|nr:uncharacterized protein LOC106090293 [Stomoxys calcitrans]XP_059224305.1 uncharacterized protein LOC106090293 [Stomoxys calcitrans]
MNDAAIGNHGIAPNQSDINRQSESPARTIDSHDSTTGSMDTIVDRTTHQSNHGSSSSANNNMGNIAVAMGGVSSGHGGMVATTIIPSTMNSHEEMMQTTIEQSTNTTNMQQHLHNSLTNSEIAMLQQQNSGGSDDELMLQQQHGSQNGNKQQLHNNNSINKPMDAQSHIYSSPVYDEKPPVQPLKLTAAALVDTVAAKNQQGGDDLKKPKLISHEEFKQQLQETIASRAATLDSRISKKQRFPPELIKDDRSSVKSSKSLKKKSSTSSSHKSSTACCSAFPVQIILGLLQLVLAISLVALGSLLIVREASLSTAGCGIWTGLIAAVTGSLGVVGLRKTQTSFLALSLVCIASSTLALAITGVGLSRDVNQSKKKFDLLNSNNEISAASGLIFTLFLHFVVSVVSVYRCALQMCSRSKTAELQDIFIKSNANGLALDPEKVDQYVKAMSISGSEKDGNEKLAALWMYAAQTASMGGQTKPKMATNGRPMMLIPATGNLTPTMMPQPMLPPPIHRPPMGAYRGMTLPYMRTASMPVIYGPLQPPHPLAGSMPGSITGTYRTQRSTKSVDPRKKRRAAGQILRSGKSDANRRQRRKSDADVIDGNPSFQYTGLDRAIADNFLARQEQTQVSSHVDYSSSSGASETYGQAAGMGPSRASSKTKIVCRDVVM